MSAPQLHLRLGDSGEITLLRQYFAGGDGSMIELWISEPGTVYELNFYPALSSREPAPPPAEERPVVFSSLLQMPVFSPNAVDRASEPRPRRVRHVSGEVRVSLLHDRELTVSDRWSKGGDLVLRLADPTSSLEAEFYLRRTGRWGDRHFVLLELPTSVLSRDTERTWVLCEVQDRDTLRTLATPEAMRCFGEMTLSEEGAAVREEAEALFGAFEELSRSNTPSRTEPDYVALTHCPICEESVQPVDFFCAACGVRLPSPRCPRCAQPLPHTE